MKNTDNKSCIESKAECTTVFYLLRHGECEGGEILRGHTDVAVSQTGRTSMTAAIDRLVERHDVEFDQLFSSPLRRCSEFSLNLYLKNGVPLKLEEGLKEINFGDWDGETLESLYQHSSQMIESYWKNPWAVTPPNGESMLEFEFRVDALWQSILQQYSGQTLLLITHAGVMRHLMANALGVCGVAGFYTQLSLAYASVVKISVFTSSQGHFTKLHWGND
ncbi:histidine phosphatase family protein [Shewanella psychrophila]|nr:histidine phosphatase family protein [Shewanella psychrophila]